MLHPACPAACSDSSLVLLNSSTHLQVWVNHKYRILYLRHAKTGSSSLFCHFNGCRGGNGQADTGFSPLQAGQGLEAGRSLGCMARATQGGLFDGVPCSAGQPIQPVATLHRPALVTLQSVPEEDLEELWRSYFVVTFVRNAYTRAVSSYRCGPAAAENGITGLHGCGAVVACGWRLPAARLPRGI